MPTLSSEYVAHCSPACQICYTVDNPCIESRRAAAACRRARGGLHAGRYCQCDRTSTPIIPQNSVPVSIAAPSLITAPRLIAGGGLIIARPSIPAAILGTAPRPIIAESRLRGIIHHRIAFLHDPLSPGLRRRR